MYVSWFGAFGDFYYQMFCQCWLKMGMSLYILKLVTLTAKTTKLTEKLEEKYIFPLSTIISIYFNTWIVWASVHFCTVKYIQLLAEIHFKCANMNSLVTQILAPPSDRNIYQPWFTLLMIFKIHRTFSIWNIEYTPIIPICVLCCKELFI